ncbi:replication protein A 70 kDa DNA-binding subunit, partial [Reticulomyxa filosa]
FTEIGKLVTKAKGAFVDVIGYVDEMTELRTIFSTTFRTILLVDPSGKVEISLWGETAQQFDEKVKESYCIVAFKGCRVTSHGGRFSICTKPKGLSLSSSNIMQINPKSLPEFASLQAWGRECSFDFAFIPHVTWKAIQSGFRINQRSTVAQLAFWRRQWPDMYSLDNDFVIKATITEITHNPEKPPWYFGSPDGPYGVVTDGRGGCPFADQILHTCAADLEQFLKDGNINEYNRVFQNALFKTKYFRVRVPRFCDRFCCIVCGLYEINPKKECFEIAFEILEDEKGNKYSLNIILSAPGKTIKNCFRIICRKKGDGLNVIRMELVTVIL